MPRRKQPRPTRPNARNAEVGGEQPAAPLIINDSDDEEQPALPIKRSRKDSTSETADEVRWQSLLLPELSSEDAKEVAEINLLIGTPASGRVGLTREEQAERTLRVRVQLPIPAKRAKFGALQEVSREDLKIQVLNFREGAIDQDNVLKDPHGEESRNSDTYEDMEMSEVMISGQVDGPDAVISAFAHLVRLGYITLRPAPCLTCGLSCCSDHDLSGRLRVLIASKAFVNFQSSHKMPLWKKAMQTLICWLRPELISQTLAKSAYQFDEEITENFERLPSSTAPAKELLFDPSALYDAVKPSWSEPGLSMSFPQLLPNLRPYQRRAAFWMVQRERGLGARVDTHSESSKTDNTINNCQGPSTSAVSPTPRCFSDEHPLWLTVPPPDGSSEFFFNPYTGAVSAEPHDFVSYVRGGILADEMGLGKTVELLACILANPNNSISTPSAVDTANILLQDKIAKRKRERVDCACGATEEDEDNVESWVQCDVCDAWQHVECVGYGSLTEVKERNSQAGEITGKKRKITRKPEEDRFVCGECAEVFGSVEIDGECGATLVVCPTPILQQWQDEILRHTRPGTLRVIVYEGVAKGAVVIMDGKEARSENNERVKVVPANELAAADIVLTTYDTLRTDLFHDTSKTQTNDRSFRYFKRYPVVPTPLTRLRWWRVCLDEAQMVEGSTSKAAEMALLLDAQNRWCVTGTPIQRGLDDLFGLFRFLQAEPFDNYQTWSKVLRQPYEAGDPEVVSYMHKFLGLIMWRSTKLLVKDELNLPPQEERLSWLRFSPVEAHFYRQQHEKCASKAQEMIAKYGRQNGLSNPGLLSETQSVPSASSEPQELQGRSALGDGRDAVEVSEQRHESQTASSSSSLGAESQTSSSSMVQDYLSKRRADADRPLPQSVSSVLSTAVLRLRQACCHPQVGSAGVRSLQQRSPMTMDEILQVLVDKAKIEAEEAQRVLIGALNGLAALAAIDSDMPLAVSIYREALAFTEESTPEDIDVDPLQKLHTLHNLADILGLVSSSHTSREESMSKIGREAQPAVVKETGSVQTARTGVAIDGTSVLNSVTEDHGTGSDAMGEVSQLEKHTNVGADATNSRTADGLSSTDAIPAVSLLGSKIPRTLRDDVLIKQCQEIRSKYMASFHLKLASGQAEFENATLQLSEAKKDCEASGGTNWWLEVLTALEKQAGQGTDLVDKIRSHLLETDDLGKRGRHRNASSLALRFREVSGLKYVVLRELDALNNARDQVLERLNGLNAAMMNPTAQDAERIANCPRETESTTGSLCAHCEMDDLFQIYENRLLLLRTSASKAHGVVSAEDAVIAQHRIQAHRRISGSKDQVAPDRSQDVYNDLARSKRGVTGAGATEAEVLNAPSETEQVLSIIKTHAKIAAGGRDAAVKHLHIFEAMKKEYSQMRALTKIQREVLLALDELNMATTRLTLQIPGEVVENEVEKLVKLPAEEVPQRNVQLTSEKFDALKDFARAKGQLRYLKGLSMGRKHELQRGVASGSNDMASGSHQERFKPKELWHHVDEETCPVCHDKLGSQLMVLPCGHLLCCKCCLVMVERTPAFNGDSRKHIGCPTCRQRTYVSDIALVDNGSGRNAIAAKMGHVPEGDKADEEASLEVNGSYGTKIEAVIRRLLWVKSKDPDAKVLIFSTWQEVLDVIQHALSVNRITFARVKGAKLDEAIRKFRGIPIHSTKSRPKRAKALDEDGNINVLLLPIERAGNGLNLVEAQHVILLEPMPNPALEAQAINRVHRIGQTRATCVHRFIVTDTVEENVYWLGRSKAELAKIFPASRKRRRSDLSLNDVNALFSPKTSAEATVNSLAAQQPRLAPAAAAAIAAEARLRLNTASQQVAAA